MRFFAPQGRHVAPVGVKFGMEEGTEGPLLHAKFHPHRCNVSPLRGEKPQNRPLSKLNTGRFALRAMLPVNIGVEGSRPRGRPKRTWREVAQKDCQAHKVNTEDAMDRGRWKKLIKIG